MSDNLNEIENLFYIESGPDWAGGWGFRCKKCGCACYSSEFYAPCKEEFVPNKIVCPECKRRWVLEIMPDDLPHSFVPH